MTSTASRLSVVIAAHELDEAFVEGLEGHASECAPDDEILVVVARSAGPAAVRLATRFPGVRWLHAPPGTLTPRLWTIGLLAASGPLIRVTIGPCRPAPGWRRAILAALDTGASVVGGAIEPGVRLRARDRAVHVLRYRNYRLPFERRERVDLPGDHAVYSRAALLSTRALWRDGFWEMDVNRALAAAGEHLVLDPGFVAHYLGGERASRFVVQRFRHGIHFGRSRLSEAPPWRRWAMAMAFMLPGVVFLSRILREASRHGSRRRLWTAGSLLWLVTFVAAWSLGEWVGALLGPPRVGRGPAAESA